MHYTGPCQWTATTKLPWVRSPPLPRHLILGNFTNSRRVASQPQDPQTPGLVPFQLRRAAKLQTQARDHASARPWAWRCPGAPESRQFPRRFAVGGAVGWAPPRRSHAQPAAGNQGRWVLVASSPAVATDLQLRFPGASLWPQRPAYLRLAPRRRAVHMIWEGQVRTLANTKRLETSRWYFGGTQAAARKLISRGAEDAAHTGVFQSSTWVRCPTGSLRQGRRTVFRPAQHKLAPGESRSRMAQLGSTVRWCHFQQSLGETPRLISTSASAGAIHNPVRAV